MGLFSKIFRPEEAKESERALREARGFFETLTAYKPVFTSWHGAIYESLIVRAAIDSKARHISKLKPQFQGTANPSLQNKMKLAPNEFQTWSQFLYRAATILECTSNLILTPVFDSRMSVTGFYTVLPNRCEVIDYKGEPWLRYKFSNGNIGAVELKKCAIMTKYQFEKDFFGDKPQKPLEDTMKLIHIQNQGIEESVKNAATFRFMAQLSNFAKPEDLAKERERFTRENLATDSKSGGFLLFPSTYKDIKQIDVKPWTVDAEQMKSIYTNVANFFGVSEAIMQNRATNEELESFFNGCVEPWSIQFSEIMTRAMFSDRERSQGTSFSVNSNRLQYMSVTQKVQMAQQMLDRGVMSINEARELFNYEPVEDGDVRFIRGEYKDTEDKIGGQNEN